MLVIVALVIVAGRSRVGAGESRWDAQIRAMDAALLAHDIKTAEWAWHEAYSAVLASRTWEGMLAVGQAYLRIGEAAHGRKIAAARARDAYLVALFRARSQGATDGVLLVAQAFADLGDRDLVDRCLKIAAGLAARSRDRAALARVQALGAHLTGHGPTRKTLDPNLLLSPEDRTGP